MDKPCFQFSKKMFDLTETLENTISLVKSESARKKIQIKLDIDEFDQNSFRTMYADESIIIQVVLDFLAQSIKISLEEDG